MKSPICICFFFSLSCSIQWLFHKDLGLSFSLCCRLSYFNVWLIIGLLRYDLFFFSCCHLITAFGLIVDFVLFCRLVARFIYMRVIQIDKVDSIS